MPRDDGLEGGIVATGDEAVEELTLAESGDGACSEEPADLAARGGELGGGHGSRPRCWTCFLLLLHDRGRRNTGFSRVFSAVGCGVFR